jgi:hypothetical protein
MSTRCQNRECDTPFTLYPRSTNDPSLCERCGDLVWAFRPNRNRPDEWFAIEDNEENMFDGQIVEGDQCEGCGLSAYTVRQRSVRLWVAVCEGQEWDGEVINGCKMEHPIRQKKAMDTIF